MSYQHLLATANETVTVPWTGGRTIASKDRTFKVEGRLPSEQGWHTFAITGGRKATWKESAFADDSLLVGKTLHGYLVGNRFIADGSSFAPNVFTSNTDVVYLREEGLERFARIRVCKWPDGRLIYAGQDFPLGPEDAVARAFQDRKDSVSDIPFVTPSLATAFYVETYIRVEAQRQRAEAERLAREVEARRMMEERRANLIRQLGDGQGRRAMAALDFESAAKAALQIADAELLDHRTGRNQEMVVQFRYLNRRFECVVDKNTLQVLDAGICLTDERTGRKDDTLLTLESLPPTIGQAIRENRLVVFRHVDGNRTYNYREDDYDDD